MNTYPSKPGLEEGEMHFTGDGRAWRWQKGAWQKAGFGFEHPKYYQYPTGSQEARRTTIIQIS